MAKVINIVTRQEETELPFSADSAKEVLTYLMEYKALNRTSMDIGEHIILRDVIKFIENASGVNVVQMIEERIAK